MDVMAQGSVEVREIPLLPPGDDVREAFELLRQRGVTPETYREVYELEAVPTTLVRERRARRQALDDRVRNETGRVLNERGINPQGHELDRNRLGRTNFVVLKSAIDRRVNALAGRSAGERHEFTRQELATINESFDRLFAEAAEEVLDAET
jgi:hypothetical protein